MSAIDEIAAERRRQVEQEGWTLEHDDSHDRAEMAIAAACYALGEPMASQVPIVHPSGRQGWRTKTVYRWPWDLAWWKPKDRRRDLIRAGALIVAEIERLDRAETAAEPA